MSDLKKLHWFHNIKKRLDKPVNDSAKVLQNVFQGSNSLLGHEFQRYKLWLKWEELLGPHIGKNSLPVGYRGGKLLIWVPNSVWLQELSFMAGPICDKVNECIGYQWVNKVIFTTDRKQIPRYEEAGEDLKNFAKKT